MQGEYTRIVSHFNGYREELSPIEPDMIYFTAYVGEDA